MDILIELALTLVGQSVGRFTGGSVRVDEQPGLITCWRTGRICVDREQIEACIDELSTLLDTRSWLS